MLLASSRFERRDRCATTDKEKERETDMRASAARFRDDRRKGERNHNASSSARYRRDNEIYGGQKRGRDYSG